MTTIHAEKQTTRRFPKERHESIYKEGTGWLIEPNSTLSGLHIYDGSDSVNIDICIPGVTTDKVEIHGHKPYLMQSFHNTPSSEEIIHVVLPKK